MRDIPSWQEYEEKCNHPVTEGEYMRYLRDNYKQELKELDDSEYYIGN